ncbi:unnamed protein product [Adineta steineri]|uniref:Alpha/beta hydrolase fold-3 domain-containing protein n=1 Tax=Adineta steineri TaxID=433720 RepID=A0A813Y3X9_9BILA|nr:unnamed protein product [Adineta steineri]
MARTAQRLAIIGAITASIIGYLYHAPNSDGIAQMSRVRGLTATMKIVHVIGTVAELFGISDRVAVVRKFSSFARHAKDKKDDAGLAIEDTFIENIPVRIARPLNNNGNLPAIVFFHGGAFYMGSVDTHNSITSYLAREANAVVISVDYRLAPEYPFPAGVDDCYTVTKYVLDHGDSQKLRIDQNRVAIAGDSAAFEGDQCRLCQRAENELNEVVNDLKRTGAWTKPILLSHFPLYRMNDEHCSRSSSSSSLKTTAQFPLLRERFDVLSQEATEHLLTTIQPRLAFSAHMHNYCYIQHNHTNNKLIPEWTIPSFSWKIRDDPSFMLMTITTNNQRVAHCSLPRETTVFWSYVIGAFLIIFYILFGGRRPYCLIVFCFLRKILKI